LGLRGNLVQCASICGLTASGKNMTALKVQPPALPHATTAYNYPYQDQLNNIHRLFYNRLTNTVNAVVGMNGAVNLQAPYAMLMSDADQASAGITSENLVTYNTPVLEQAIEVRNSSEIWFEYPGQYFVTFSLMFTNRGNNNQIIEVWAKDSNANYPLSNTRYDIPARKSLSEWSHVVATVSGIFTVDTPDTDYLSIAWWSDGANVFLEHYAAGTNPTRPAIPSVILTVNFISRLP
jgi:hypothetical protein